MAIRTFTRADLDAALAAAEVEPELTSLVHSRRLSVWDGDTDRTCVALTVDNLVDFVVLLPVLHQLAGDADLFDSRMRTDGHLGDGATMAIYWPGYVLDETTVEDAADARRELTAVP